MSVKTKKSITEAILMLQELNENGKEANGSSSGKTEEFKSISFALKNIGNMVSELDETINQIAPKDPKRRRRFRRFIGRILIAIGEFLLEDG